MQRTNGNMSSQKHECTPEMLETITSLLGSDVMDGCEVTDVKDNLVMINYKKDSDMNVYGKYRGYLLDLQRKRLVCDSFGYTPTVVCDKIMLLDDSSAVFYDSTGVEYEADFEKSTILPLHEGVLMRVVYLDGKMHTMTHKKIDSSKSKWGTSVPFSQLYTDAGCPTVDEMFDTKTENSSTCYFFLVFDNSLSVGTRKTHEKPGHIYLGSKDFVYDNFSKGIYNRNLVSSMTVDEANEYLECGITPRDQSQFHPTDCRLDNGEALVINTGEIYLRVYSRSFDWRVKMRGNNPNIETQYYKLLSMFSKKGGCYPSDINKIMPLIKSSTIDSTFVEKYKENHQNIQLFEYYTYNYPYNLAETSKLVWANYVLSLPPFFNNAANTFYNNYLKMKNDVSSWIYHISVTDQSYTELPDRVINILTESKRISKQRLLKNGKRNITDKDFTDMLKSTINFFVNNEHPMSLKTIDRDMKLIKEGKYQKLQS